MFGNIGARIKSLFGRKPVQKVPQTAYTAPERVETVQHRDKPSSARGRRLARSPGHPPVIHPDNWLPTRKAGE